MTCCSSSRRQARAHIHLGHLGEDVDPRLIDGIGNQNLCHHPACEREARGGEKRDAVAGGAV